jgi:uncharacterized protein
MKSQPYHTVRMSKIHGRGVFARRPIRTGTRIIEYTGPIISEKEAEEIGVATENGHSHTMLFQIDKKRCINGNEGGDARFLNHSCDPNCETEQDGDRIFIKALRPIKKGEELVYDYHLQVPGKITDKVKKEYACFCGSPKCRGTQIATEILAKQAKKDEKKKVKQLAAKVADLKKAEKKKLEDLKKAEKKKAAEGKTGKKKDKAAEKKEKKGKKKNKSKKKNDSLTLMVEKKASPAKDKKKGGKKKDKKKKK